MWRPITLPSLHDLSPGAITSPPGPAHRSPHATLADDAPSPRLSVSPFAHVTATPVAAQRASVLRGHVKAACVAGSHTLRVSVMQDYMGGENLVDSFADSRRPDIGVSAETKAGSAPPRKYTIFLRGPL
ncbi:hypothetical protein D8674_005310 [Pyrus ussuriensis x Pyrus communis]|uniref:Uncharacterized protein n=1 Tax=Pyrus ussuriensis x Pyrus communis TaxID=2448454 RepID=A0A5N5FRH5_9ROSA|nr:hypothetical protein D8674_005310 [Pyrus ussuriensis x Pyrus communis]